MVDASDNLSSSVTIRNAGSGDLSCQFGVSNYQDLSSSTTIRQPGSADLSSSFNVGYWHEWDCPIGSFPSILATALANAGWTRAEEGYDTMSPAGYASIYFILVSEYGTLTDNDGGSGTSSFTYLTARISAGYDAVSHIPDASENGGRSRFRLIDSTTDYSASTTVKYDIKGWITSTCCLLWIHSEAVSGGDKRQIIFCGEMDRLDGKNKLKTPMLLCSEYVSEIGTRSINQSYASAIYETHFIHCIGDLHVYIPYSSGYGVSGYDNKIRPQVVVAWRYAGSGLQSQGSPLWNIPSDVLRACRFAGIEADEDTFIDGSETFIKVSRPNFGDTGGIYLIKDTYNTMEDAGYWWFRKG